MLFLSEPVAFRRVYGLEAYSRISGNRTTTGSVTIPTAPRELRQGRIQVEFKGEKGDKGKQGSKGPTLPVPKAFGHTVASMLLIFPCMRLDCVSSASKTCLDYVWSANVFMLSVRAILPAQVSLPSLVEVVGWLHN